MTLDEKIVHCEEIADFCEYEATRYDMTDSYESYMAGEQGKCADEHRQLAEWLKDYKRLKEQEPKTDRVKTELSGVKAELEKETCEDCISRQEAIRAIEALQRPIMREVSDYYQFKFSGMSEAREAVVNLPPVTPQEAKTDLDKIRAEIERKANSGQWSEATIYGMQKSIAIIDKYRGEG